MRRLAFLTSILNGITETEGLEITLKDVIYRTHEIMMRLVKVKSKLS